MLLVRLLKSLVLSQAVVIQASAVTPRAASSASLTPTSTLTLAPTGTVPASYLQVSGSAFVDNAGNTVTLRGCNLGGWLVMEDWMCGIADDTDDAGYHDGRQSFTTLTNRFGLANATNLLSIWENGFITAQDFVNIKNLGFNLIRIPFAWTNLQNSDGSFKSNAFDLLDFAVEQAKTNSLYVILDLHVWQTQYEDYDLISENSNAGAAARTQAQQLWQNISAHYLGEGTIAAFDVINEPDGSYANYLQRALYDAVRSEDPNRIIILESYNGVPSTYNWHQVAFSFHEYGMEGSNLTYNEDYWQPNKTSIENVQAIPVPFYMGEFMASNQTLTYLLQEMNELDIAWTMWTYKAVDQGDWAFYNYPHYPADQTFRININTDSYESILNTWLRLNTTNATANTNLIDLFAPYS